MGSGIGSCCLGKGRSRLGKIRAVLVLLVKQTFQCALSSLPVSSLHSYLVTSTGDLELFLLFLYSSYSYPCTVQQVCVVSPMLIRLKYCIIIRTGVGIQIGWWQCRYSIISHRFSVIKLIIRLYKLYFHQVKLFVS